jgi:hypothetical protein
MRAQINKADIVRGATTALSLSVAERRDPEAGRSGDRALDLNQDTLERGPRVLGEDHPDANASAENLCRRLARTRRAREGTEAGR